MIKDFYKLIRNITYVRKVFTKTLIFVTLGSMILSLSGCSLIPKEEEILAPKLKEPPKVVFDTLVVKRSNFEMFEKVQATFIAARQIDLSFLNLNGRLKSINVTLGDEVKKGAILAELITGNLGNEIKQQEIALKKSQLNINTIKLNGQKDIDISKRQLDSLKKKLKSMESIPDSYSKEEIKDFKEQIEEKEIVYKNSVAIYQNNIKVAENDFDSCQLQLDTLNQSMNNSKLISPIDGTIDYITDIKDGTNIDAYTSIVSIVDTKNLNLSYSGDKSNKFSLGTKVGIILNDFKTEGEVVMTPASIPAKTSEETNPTVYFKLSKLPAGVRHGDTANIILRQVTEDNVIVVNKNMIRTVGDRKFVNVLQNGIKKERDVQVGNENLIEAVVVKGLSEGDLLIK